MKDKGNEKRRKRKNLGKCQKCYGSKRAVRPDDKYVLVNMNINRMVFMGMAKTG